MHSAIDCHGHDRVLLGADATVSLVRGSHSLRPARSALIRVVGLAGVELEFTVVRLAPMIAVNLSMKFLQVLLLLRHVLRLVDRGLLRDQSHLVKLFLPLHLLTHSLFSNAVSNLNLF